VNLFCGLIANSAPIHFVLAQSYLASIRLKSFIRGIS